MTVPPNPSLTKEYAWTVVRVLRTGLIFVALYFVVVGALVWLWPWSLIALQGLALAWCLLRMGQGKRFSLRGLLILTAGLAIVMATAAFVPGSMLGVAGIGVADKIVIEVVDGTTGKPIDDADVVLTHRDENLMVAATYQGTTNAQGATELPCEVSSASRRSILREWRTYSFDNWLLEAKAPGYHPAERVLSDVTIYGKETRPLRFRIELERNKPW